MKAAVYDQCGGPEVFRYEGVLDPECPADGVLIRIKAVAIEGGDLINRASSPPPHPSYVVGYAAAGLIAAVGADVSGRHLGQKVASFNLAGSHAELRAVPATRTWIMPEGQRRWHCTSPVLR
ncbi:hypothetical protein B6S44_08430 [Bosea sp. Tri-44]|uniref:quinone oxidoreductase family protein n=1 Tax=Bosea sp. Tri-44 TaxID=1972137 RepID=UPI00100E7F39|nr:zinc-binding alcohol dehydrogenase family protein [Bosea sp. Tri-44]RXT56084.1 hypothetical protein B6S44_08430 [Bosea sp. Tri-44]